ncbi:MAG TPA: Rho termination factor N-terminal domain-containing protein [Solirubrobacterales bacterium]|nr:Rho termination factor N-terminal domain-containing protein [Solirubrobacterales bacterium]
MPNADLNSKHIADLHELASERGIDGYRKLTRTELIDELGGDSGGGDSGGRGGRGGKRGGRGRGGRGRGGGRGGDGGGGRDEEQDEELDEPVSGVLEITSRGHGFIKLDDPELAEGDIYVSPSQIRRCELEAGDVIAGPARKARRGERHPALVHIDTVNGAEPGERGTKFEELDAVPASRRLPLTGEAVEADDEKLLLRSIDLLAPLARGHRVLVNATRGSGRTTLLRALARELAKAEDLEVVVALIDERPEEETAWREALPDVELAIASADMRPGEQLRVVELAVAKAKRKAEAGGDVALLIDSLSRLAVAADDPGATKPVFAAGRETSDDDAGSLTVVATALTGIEDGGVAKALATTENVTLTLNADIAAAGVYPALDVSGCRVTGEGELLSEPELAGLRALRAELADLEPLAAAERLAEHLGKASSNEALLADLADE